MFIVINFEIKSWEFESSPFWSPNCLLRDSAMDTRRNRIELYKQPPPPFGHALLKYFAIDPEYINLNNGSVLTTIL